MSIRSFVVLSSLLLMTWLGLAFVHTSELRSGFDPISAELNESADALGDEAEELAVSGSH